MILGGMIGAAGVGLPGIELGITLSVVVFVALVARRARLGLGVSMLLVGFFAFFHGYAHGAEMPGSTGFVGFALGFVVATLLLHAIGLLAGRGIAIALACLIGSSAIAQETTNSPVSEQTTNALVSTASTNTAATNAVVRLPEVTVQGRQDSMLGIAGSASQGTTGAAQLEDRPILRSGEILETVPGVIITQHAGGGKANQYFLRGFNLDHGTDFAVYLDDMPLNLPSHAHGEGYSDMNTVIPEFVERIDYEKGPYYADVGNYGSAGAAHLVFYKTLPENFADVEAGMFNYKRAVFGISQKTGDGNLLYGAEAYYDDGPWVNPDGYRKFNGIMTYSRGDDMNGFSITAHDYYGKWHSSDQIPASFADTNFFGTVNPTDGGMSERYSLQIEGHRHDENSETKITAYGFFYYLDLYSDFTYYLTDPTLGDQFEQQDKRWVGGLDARHTIFNQWFGDRDVENTFGMQIRNDWIDNGLYQTENRNRVDKIDSATGTILPAVTEADDFTDTQVGVWFENKIEWSDKFRSVAAIRGDLDYFAVNSLVTNANSGTAGTILPSPKLSLIFGPWARTEFYVNGGFGFHSNDGRGATQNVEPTSADNPIAGTPSERIPALVQTKGAEIGVRTLVVPHFQSTVSLWYLYSDSELQQDGDTGSTVASAQPSNRYGVEWANYYNPIDHLAFDMDLADSVARFTRVDSDDAAPISPGSTTLGPGGTRVPEAVGWVVSAGVTLHDLDGFSASLRLRYFGPRDLTSDGIYRSSDTLLLNAEVRYQVTKTWHVFVEFLNLLDRRDHDIDYAYTSQVSPTAQPRFEDVLHPVEPFQVRGGVSVRF
jgi:outer membrane receptor for Fe3+-dicitrate